VPNGFAFKGVKPARPTERIELMNMPLANATPPDPSSSVTVALPIPYSLSVDAGVWKYPAAVGGEPESVTHAVYVVPAPELSISAVFTPHDPVRSAPTMTTGRIMDRGGRFERSGV